MGTERIGIDWRRAVMLAVALAWATGITMTGCARLPYTTRTVHEEERVVVNHRESLDNLPRLQGLSRPIE